VPNGGVSTTLNAIAFILPLAGIALSWWSFRWAEAGATPDTYGDIWTTLQLEETQLQMGQRNRARCCARICFNAGALLLAASVPMGSAANNGRFNLSAFAALLIVAFAAAYVALQVLQIWKNLREDAFGIYFNKDMCYLYDREKTREIYFRLNPMPIWTLLDRSWFEKLTLPNINEVFATASKTPPPGSTMSIPQVSRE
jgi:hypothetical protein